MHEKKPERQERKQSEKKPQAPKSQKQKQPEKEPGKPQLPKKDPNRLKQLEKEPGKPKRLEKELYELKTPQSHPNQIERVVGIIAEYNPFHNGHRYHLEQAVEKTGAAFVIAVMSGNFLQRGGPALYDKWVRAKAAVQNGVDVVFELPFAFACNSAEYFACGAVALLEGLGCVSHLAFGSESGSLPHLKAAAAFLAEEPEAFRTKLKKHLDKGISYPKARYQALLEAEGQEQTARAIQTPNDILAVEYLKQLIRQKSSMEPVLVKRSQAGYKDLHFQGHMASAAAIREVLHTDGLEKIRQVVPEETYALLSEKGCQALAPDLLFPMLQYKIITTAPDEIARVFAVSEGLEHKIIKEIPNASHYEGLIRSVASKRYPQTRIRRSLTHLLLHFVKEDMQWIMDSIDTCLYARVLGFSQKGRHLLSQIKKSEASRIPVYTNISRQAEREGPAGRLLHFDVLAAGLYHIIRREALYTHSDYVRKPYVAK